MAAANSGAKRGRRVNRPTSAARPARRMTDRGTHPMNASKPDQQGILPRDLFAGKTVFVTGGGSGINLGIARTFAGLGAKIGICGRSQERLDAAAAGLRELGAKVSATSADVRMPD